MSLPKIDHQKGSFGQIKKNPLFRFCRPILDIFGLTLLKILSESKLTTVISLTCESNIEATVKLAVVKH